MERRIVRDMLDGTITDRRHAVAMGICLVLPGLLLFGAAMLGAGDTGRADVIMGVAGAALAIYGIGWTMFNLHRSTKNMEVLRLRLDSPGRAAR